MIRRPPRSTLDRSSAASDVYKRQLPNGPTLSPSRFGNMKTEGEISVKTKTNQVVRSVQNLWKSKPTIEGAGVHLRRAFGFHEMPGLDPFLLMDDFRSENPRE